MRHGEKSLPVFIGWFQPEKEMAKDEIKSTMGIG
jgi:hypothetical protein